MKQLTPVAGWLVVVGAINWGLAALGFNVVDMVLGVGSPLGQIVYIVIGLAGAWMAYTMATKK
ncbi:DUF378 domain-containing protein [Candidatus Daviesbacteria bacterium]|nr:DUF378 domain-containing protein [Candidatus Daviesbacteria bacterium]